MSNPQVESLLFAAVLVFLQPIQIEEVNPGFQIGGLRRLLTEAALPYCCPDCLAHLIILASAGQQSICAAVKKYNLTLKTGKGKEKSMLVYEWTWAMVLTILVNP